MKDILDKTVIELVSIYKSYITKSPFWQFEVCDLIADFIDLDYCFISEEELEKLSDTELIQWQEKKLEVFGIIDNLFKDDSLPNWYLYNTDLVLDTEIWKPLCSSQNHSPRFQHIISSIVLETDWRGKSIRCKSHRYRFYTEDLNGVPVTPYLLETNSVKMAMLFVQKIEGVDYGSSIHDIVKMLSLFFPIQLKESPEDTGEVFLLNQGKNLLIEVTDRNMLLIEREEITETYLTEPYERDNIEVLYIVKDLLAGNII